MSNVIPEIEPSARLSGIQSLLTAASQGEFLNFELPFIGGNSMHNPDWEDLMDPDAPLPFELGSWVDLAPFERALGMKIEYSGNGNKSSNGRE